MDQKKLVAFLELTFAVVVWGASFIATKVVLRDISPATLVWIRFGMGWIILGIAMLVRRQYSLPARNELAYLALLGFIGISFHQWLQSNGLQTSQASTTAWIVATIPVFMALLGWLFLNERLTLLQVAGIGLATCGVLLVVSQGEFSKLFSGGFGAPGDILILVSSLNWAIFSTLSRPGLSKRPATQMMFYVMGFGWLFISLLFFAQSGWHEIEQLSQAGWMGIIFLGIAGSGLAYIFWYDGLQSIPSAQAGAFLYIEPLVAVVVAAIILGEPLLLASILGGAAILLGVWLVNRRINSPA